MNSQIKQRIEKIKNGKVPDGYKRTKVGIVPDEWKETKLSNYLEVSNDKNTNLKYGKNDVFSISGELGVVNQIELLGRSYAGASVAQYGIVCPNDIVYTKSPLKANPYGIIKTNKSGKYGIVSTLYAIFHCKDNVLPDYVQLYFDSNQNLNNYLYPIVNIGAKHDMKISDENSLMGNVVFPPLAEQKKIAEILATQDKIIELKERKIEELKKLKKYYLNKMFPKKGTNYPEVRFPGFTDPWEQRKLTEFVEFFSGLTYTPNDVQENGTLVLRSSNVSNGEVVDADNVYVNPQVVNSENVKVGDIVVVVRNGSRSLIGKHAQIKAFMPNTVIGAFMTGIRSECPEFTNALLNTSRFEEEIAMNMGATINQITGYMFSKMEFKVPCLDEQKKIGEYFEKLDNLITLHQRELDEEKKFKKSLMQLLLKGIVRV